MKKSILAAVFTFVTMGGFSAHAQSEIVNGPKFVKGAFLTGYIPNGFDSNDKVQVVAEGLFPNTCFRPAGYQQKVDVRNKTIELVSKAYQYSGMCLQMIVPYHEVIDVGLLEAGVYKIKDSKHGDLGTLNVKLATSSAPDDFLYAPVSQAMIDTTDEGHSVIVTGQFTNSCVEFKEMKIDVQKNVIVVLPITEAADRSDCKEGSFPFRQVAKIDSSVPSGRYLLHVRSLNGSAINNLVDIK